MEYLFNTDKKTLQVYTIWWFYHIWYFYLRKCNEKILHCCYKFLELVFFFLTSVWLTLKKWKFFKKIKCQTICKHSVYVFSILFKYFHPKFLFNICKTYSVVVIILFAKLGFETCWFQKVNRTTFFFCHG